MTKFEKFSEVVIDGFIYPVVLALVSIIAGISIYVFAGIELMWMVYVALTLCALTGIWGIAFLTVITVTKVAEWREERQWRKENPYEAE